MLKVFYFFMVVLCIIAAPLGVMATDSGHTGSKSHTTHTSSGMGHTAYHRSETTVTTTKSSTSSSHSSSNSTSKTYHPGVTHSAAIRNANEAHTVEMHKASEKKKSEDAQKKAEQADVKSINTRISPAKPKASKPAPAKGPFVSK